MAVDQIVSKAEDVMKKAVEFLRNELRGVRTGQASAGLVDGVKVEVESYGSTMGLKELGSIANFYVTPTTRLEFLLGKQLPYVAVGFAGVLIILRPGLGVVDPWALVALFGAFLFALYQVLTRMLTRDDTAESTLLWTGLVGLAVTSVAGPLHWVY